jgi:hypothetical protein
MLLSEWFQPLRFSKIHHGQAAPAGKNVGAAACLFHLDGMDNLRFTERNHVAEGGSLLECSGCDQRDRLKPMAALEMGDLGIALGSVE